MKPSHKQIYNFGQIARPPELLLSRKSRPDVERMLGPDRLLAQRLYRKIRDGLIENEVPLTPAVGLRIRDILSAFLLIRRLEDTLCREGPLAAPVAKENDNARFPSAPHPIAEARAKAWERLRRSLHELAERCGRGPKKPAPQATERPLTFAEQILPILDAGEGLLDDPTIYEPHPSPGTAHA